MAREKRREEAKTRLDDIVAAFSAAANLLGGRSPEIAALCKQLNAFSVDRLDEPDYDKRYPAYDAISMADNLDDYGWMPLVHNGLFFIREHEDQGIQNGATRILKRFIDTNSSMETTPSVVYPTSRLMRGVLLPALKRGASENMMLMSSTSWTSLHRSVPGRSVPRIRLRGLHRRIYHSLRVRVEARRIILTI